MALPGSFYCRNLLLLFLFINSGICPLFQVGKLNPKDNSYALKDEFYRHVQRDWPGYLEEEKQFVHRLLVRWVLSIIKKNLQ